MKFDRALSILIAAIVAVVVWLFASRAQRINAALDRELEKRRGKTDNPSMSETFAHEVTPADPVQAFRSGGAI